MRRALPALLVSLDAPCGATYETARAVGKRCSACHDSKRPDVTNLNASGRYYMVHRRLKATTAPGAPERRNMPSSGRAVFSRNCTPCHGPAGEGTSKAKTLLGRKERANTQAEIAALVRRWIDGTSMFPFEGLLSDTEIQAVARYVASLGRP